MTPSATPKVTKEAIRKAEEIDLARCAFSLDGPNAEFHDHVRGMSGSFDLTMKAIEYLHELEILVQIITVITRYNTHVLDEMVKLVEELKCVLWNVFFLMPTGRGKQSDMISPLEHENVFRWLYETS
jgi:AdoMet-dependent heme synthase